MNFNLKIMVMVFLLALLLSVFTGNYLHGALSFVIPLVAGLTAGYLVDGNYTDAVVNAGISVGLAGFVYTIGIPEVIFYLIYGILGGLLGFAVRERKIILQILK
jgi:hypothetical protein